jgi:hypothetical protein
MAATPNPSNFGPVAILVAIFLAIMAMVAVLLAG